MSPSENSKPRFSHATRTRALVVASIVVIASITGITLAAQTYALKGLNGQVEPVATGNWLPLGLNASFSHAMLYRNSHLRSISNHVIETGQDAALKQYAQALLRKVDDWDARIIARLKVNGIETGYAENGLNDSYKGFEDMSTTLSSLTGAELDTNFKAQMQTLATQITKRLQSDISLLDDKELEGIAAEILGSNNSVSQEINAG